MTMIQELNIVDPINIQGRKKIDTEPLKLGNHRLQLYGQMISHSVIAMLVGDSNNSSSELTPTEVREHWAQWDASIQEWNFIKKYNDGPLVTHEKNLVLLKPTPTEVMKVYNRKLKRVVQEDIRLLELICSVDSAGKQAHVGLNSQKDIEAQQVICEAAMLHYLGKGKDANDTGVILPEYRFVGAIMPDLDKDYAELAEPSSGTPDVGRPDAPDVDGSK